MTDNILNIKNLSIGYKRALLKNINITAEKGKLISLMGSNGIGKSTFLKTITGLHKKLEGEIIINNIKLKDYSNNKLAKTVSFVSSSFSFSNNLTVTDILKLGRFPYTGRTAKLKKEDKEKINECIEIFSLKDYLNKPVSNISDGERQRVMIARAYAQDTELIFLDEPTAFLDINNKYLIVDLLKKLCRKNKKTIIFSSHDIDICLKISDFIWIMDKNGISYNSPENLKQTNTLNKLVNTDLVKFDKKTNSFIFKNEDKE